MFTLQTETQPVKQTPSAQPWHPFRPFWAWWLDDSAQRSYNICDWPMLWTRPSAFSMLWHRSEHPWWSWITSGVFTTSPYPCWWTLCCSLIGCDRKHRNEDSWAIIFLFQDLWLLIPRNGLSESYCGFSFRFCFVLWNYHTGSVEQLLSFTVPPRGYQDSNFSTSSPACFCFTESRYSDGWRRNFAVIFVWIPNN